MREENNIQADYSIYTVQRLTALWAFSEAGLGGILHALNIPLKGLILSAIAALCMTLIAFYSKDCKALLRTLVIVLIVKLLGAPNSSPAAYIAVTFQGLMGYLLFSLFGRGIRLSALLLSVVAITYSSVQKIFVAYLLYGKPLAKAINGFAENALEFFGYSGQTDIVWQLCAAYIGIHVVSGIAVGIFAGSLPQRVEVESQSDAFRSIVPASNEPAFAKGSSRKRKNLRILFFLILPLLLLIIFTLLNKQTPQEGALALGILVLRIVCILALWYGIIADVAMKIIKRILKEKQHKYAREVENVLLVLPLLRSYVLPVWQSTNGMGMLSRLRLAVVRMIAVALSMPIVDTLVSDESSSLNQSEG